MNAREKAIEAVHSRICDESLSEHMDPMWPGRCVKAVQAAAPHLTAAAWEDGRATGVRYPYGKQGLGRTDNPYARKGEDA